MSERNLMGLELYSIWNKTKNPRSKPADWFRYRKGIKHCNPNREMLKEILLPIFKTYADNYVWRIEEGEDPEKDQTHPTCLLYTSPSPRDGLLSRMPSSA